MPVEHPRAVQTPGLWIEWRRAWQVRSHYVRLQLWVAWATKPLNRELHEFCFGRTRSQARRGLFERLDEIDRKVL